MASFAHDTLLVSLIVPDDWDVEQVAPQQIRFFGPEHQELDGYRPTFSITMGEPEGFGDEWFDAFCEASLQQLRDNYEGFELLRTERTTLSSLAPMNEVWYAWQPEDELRFAQVQALVPVDAFRMYLINAATMRELEDTYLPVFEQVLHSLRILPAKG